MSMRPSNQLWLPLESEGDMFGVNADSESPSEDEGLMERVVERENLFRALKRVQDNGGSPGVDCLACSAETIYQRIVSTEPPWYVMRMPGGVGGGKS